MKQLNRIIGYALLFILSLVPALIAYWQGAGANEIGLIYVGTIIWTGLLWFAIHYIEKNEEVI